MKPREILARQLYPQAWIRIDEGRGSDFDFQCREEAYETVDAQLRALYDEGYAIVGTKPQNFYKRRTNE